MKQVFSILILIACAFSAGATLVEFGTDGTSTGDNLLEVNMIMNGLAMDLKRRLSATQEEKPELKVNS